MCVARGGILCQYIFTRSFLWFVAQGLFVVAPPPVSFLTSSRQSLRHSVSRCGAGWLVAVDCCPCCCRFCVWHHKHKARLCNYFRTKSMSCFSYSIRNIGNRMDQVCRHEQTIASWCLAVEATRLVIALPIPLLYVQERIAKITFSAYK